MQNIKANEREKQYPFTQKELIGLSFFQEFIEAKGQESWPSIMQAVDKIQVKKGERLIEFDTIPQKVYIIVSGRVSIYRENENRNIQIPNEDKQIVKGVELSLIQSRIQGQSVGMSDMIAKRNKYNYLAISEVPCILAVFSQSRYERILKPFQENKVKQLVAFFKKIHIFEKLSQHQIAEVADYSTRIINLRGDVLFKQGNEINSIFLVMEGIYSYLKFIPDERNEVKIDTQMQDLIALNSELPAKPEYKSKNFEQGGIIGDQEIMSGVSHYEGKLVCESRRGICYQISEKFFLQYILGINLKRGVSCSIEHMKMIHSRRHDETFMKSLIPFKDFIFEQQRRRQYIVPKGEKLFQESSEILEKYDKRKTNLYKIQKQISQNKQLLTEIRMQTPNLSERSSPKIKQDKRGNSSFREEQKNQNFGIIVNNKKILQGSCENKEETNTIIKDSSRIGSPARFQVEAEADDIVKKRVIRRKYIIKKDFLEEQRHRYSHQINNFLEQKQIMQQQINSINKSILLSYPRSSTPEYQASCFGHAMNIPFNQKGLQRPLFSQQRKIRRKSDLNKAASFFSHFDETIQNNRSCVQSPSGSPSHDSFRVTKITFKELPDQEFKQYIPQNISNPYHLSAINRGSDHQKKEDNKNKTPSFNEVSENYQNYQVNESFQSQKTNLARSINLAEYFKLSEHRAEYLPISVQRPYTKIDPRRRMQSARLERNSLQLD